MQLVFLFDAGGDEKNLILCQTSILSKRGWGGGRIRITPSCLMLWKPGSAAVRLVFCLYILYAVNSDPSCDPFCSKTVPLTSSMSGKVQCSNSHPNTSSQKDETNNGKDHGTHPRKVMPHRWSGTTTVVTKNSFVHKAMLKLWGILMSMFKIKQLWMWRRSWILMVCRLRLH